MSIIKDRFCGNKHCGCAFTPNSINSKQKYCCKKCSEKAYRDANRGIFEKEKLLGNEDFIAKCPLCSKQHRVTHVMWTGGSFAPRIYCRSCNLFVGNMHYSDAPVRLQKNRRISE
jgi:hypothetical protein